MREEEKIKLYGAESCAKTKYYLDILEQKNLKFSFYDVTNNREREAELRSLYASGKANFPTFLIGHKKLRNPNHKELSKWLAKAAAANYENLNALSYDHQKFNFSCGIRKVDGDVSDAIEY